MYLCRPAVKQYLSTFHHYQKPDNRGYDSYTDADEAWAFYKERGVLPLAPVDGGVAASISSMAHHPSSPSPSVAQASPAHHALSSSAHRTRQVGRTHPALQAGIPAIFYIVHVGYSPGVYNSL